MDKINEFLKKNYHGHKTRGKIPESIYLETTSSSTY